MVGRKRAGDGVHDEQYDVGLFDGDLRLLADGGFDDVVGRGDKPAGVDERERAPGPFGVGVMAVARHAGQVVHDGIAMADDAVEERGLPDVRTSDDGDERAVHDLTGEAPIPQCPGSPGHRR